MPSLFSLDGWRQAASHFAMDWSMIWKDIVIGIGLWRLSKQAPEAAHYCAHHGQQAQSVLFAARGCDHQCPEPLQSPSAHSLHALKTAFRLAG